MSGAAFFFISLLMRSVLVAFGLLCAYIFWDLLAELLWMDVTLLKAAHALKATGGIGFNSLWALLIAVYGLGLLLSILAACAGLWLIYKRLRGGIDAARYIAPESLGSRVMAAIIFGVFGLFFTLMSIGHLRTAVNVFNTAVFASTGEAVVLEKKDGVNPDRTLIGPLVDVRLVLPDGSERIEEVYLPWQTYDSVEVGDTVSVMYWPAVSGDVVAEDDYSLRRVVYFLFKTLVVIVLALVGLSSCWTCIRGNPEPDKPSQRQTPGSEVRKLTVNSRGGARQFGKRA